MRTAVTTGARVVPASPASLAVGGRRVVLDARIRRDGAARPSRTFAEQLPGLTYRYGRWKVRPRTVLERIGPALAGCAGAHHARAWECRWTRTTLWLSRCPTRLLWPHTRPSSRNTIV